MTTTEAKKKVIVVGGGIAGLSAGIYALKAGFDAEIYEKNYGEWALINESLMNYWEKK